jgi:hypothetical protein
MSDEEEFVMDVIELFSMDSPDAVVRMGALASGDGIAVYAGLKEHWKSEGAVFMNWDEAKSFADQMRKVILMRELYLKYEADGNDDEDAMEQEFLMALQIEGLVP